MTGRSAHPTNSPREQAYRTHAPILDTGNVEPQERRRTKARAHSRRTRGGIFPAASRLTPSVAPPCCPGQPRAAACLCRCSRTGPLAALLARGSLRHRRLRPWLVVTLLERRGLWRRGVRRAHFLRQNLNLGGPPTEGPCRCIHLRLLARPPPPPCRRHLPPALHGPTAPSAVPPEREPPGSECRRVCARPPGQRQTCCHAARLRATALRQPDPHYYDPPSETWACPSPRRASGVSRLWQGRRLW